MLKGPYYSVDGRYLEFDGHNFGMDDLELEVNSFKGAKKITSLEVYPLMYHQDYDSLRQRLIERGKKFTAMDSMAYLTMKGLAFYKKNNKTIKVNVNGRVIVDPAVFRRINPNYPVGTPKPDDKDIIETSDRSDNDGSESTDSSDDFNAGQFGTKKKTPNKKQKLVKMNSDDSDEGYQVVDVPVDEEGNTIQEGNLIDKIAKTGFTDQDYLVASPVALGFSFGEKLWVEFAVSGLSPVVWNEGSFDSLVLPDDQKDVVRALVESHHHENKNNNIDDVIQGKGRGLVAVLHGPPGTGKTLTAESIAELLKKPLYMVSVGELGTRPDYLEKNLTQILDIAHSWGALLLLDEADVFLEQRQTQDIGRNALVSVFLRLLEVS